MKGRTAWRAIEEITPTRPEKEVEGQKEEEKKDEGLECELQSILHYCSTNQALSTLKARNMVCMGVAWN